MKPVVLVTGADGFIGSHLVRELESRAYAVRTHKLADGDIASGELPYPDCRHVFHLAARSFVPDSWTDPVDFYRVNVLGTVNVLELCRRTGASLTYISSYVYGTPRSLPVGEDHPLQAFNPYSHTKILAEETCRFYAQQHGLRICLIRPFNIYGAGQESRFLIPMLVRQAASASDVIEVADERPRRDFLYVTDLIRLLLATIESDCAGAYNAGSGVSVSIAEIVDILNRFLPAPKMLRSRGERRPQEVLDVRADIGKARRELNWTPAVDLEQGLRLILSAVTGATV